MIPRKDLQIETPYIREFLPGEMIKVVREVFDAVAEWKQPAPVEEGVMISHNDHNTSRVAILWADDFLANPTKIVDQPNGRARVCQIRGEPLC